MTDADIQELPRVVQKLGYLIDLTRVIDRNMEDGNFAKQGGTIHYVFDTNVVQMFLEPFRTAKYAEVFHSSLWDNEPILDQEINSQSCLIAAEYLLSGRLPGQKAGHWYMSNGHWGELLTQVDYLKHKIGKTNELLREDSHFKKDSLLQLQALNSALQFERDDKDTVLALAERTGTKSEELEEAAKLPAAEFKKWAVGMRSREVCRILALDHVLEPPSQIKRFEGSMDMRDARRSLEDLLHVGELNREIFREIRAWHRALSSVLTRRGTGSRTEAAIRADCEALALISWGSRERLRPDERVVFVTGDRALLETYKLRHVDEPDSGPFLLRPINHFVPVFNPSSAGSMLRSKEFAFRTLREALEGAMLALNLGLFNLEQPEVRLRARDHFSVKVAQEIGTMAALLLRFFPLFGRRSWLLKQEQRLQSLVKRLRPFEVLMLEAYPSLVAARLEQRREEFLLKSENAGDEIDAEIVAQLKQAKRSGFRLSLQLMGDTVRELLDRIGRRKSDWKERALIALRLSFSDDPRIYVSYNEEIGRLQVATNDELERLLGDLAKEPPHIFALAAVLAFSLEYWKEAVRYSALAANASTETVSSNTRNSAAEDHYELLYLAAVSLRFRLSAWDASQSAGYGNPLKEWVFDATEELRKCETYHQRHDHKARLIRTFSERASLTVSYCEWLVFGPQEVAKLYEAPGEIARDALRNVVSDLARCETLLGTATRHAEARESQGQRGSTQVLELAKRQFRFNMLAARLVGEKLVMLWPDLEQGVEQVLAGLPEWESAEWNGKPPLATAYVAATTNDLPTLQSINLEQVTLPLDRAIIEGLCAMVVERHARRKQFSPENFA